MPPFLSGFEKKGQIRLGLLVVPLFNLRTTKRFSFLLTKRTLNSLFKKLNQISLKNLTSIGFGPIEFTSKIGFVSVRARVPYK